MLTPLEIDDVFDLQECGEIIRVVESRLFADAGLVRGEMNDNIRRARIAWLDSEGESVWIFDRLVDTVIAANREHFGFDLTEFAEKAQVAWYDAGQGGHFDWHVDMGDGQFAARRKLTLVVQLSADESYEGGNLELNADGQTRTVSRKLGTATLFPSFTPHRVTPMTRHSRYSMTTWVHGPAFR
ncbi:MAG: 2OG-Fe(II) oxygenase [Minwuia sp.]|uniref:2OG-Fe(II) oxygenase n=1 Tax=Minwuia sp. TaxID=2493630 RepID=UPI003A837FCB